MAISLPAGLRAISRRLSSALPTVSITIRPHICVICLQVDIFIPMVERRNKESTRKKERDEGKEKQIRGNISLTPAISDQRENMEMNAARDVSASGMCQRHKPHSC